MNSVFAVVLMITVSGVVYMHDAYVGVIRVSKSKHHD